MTRDRSAKLSHSVLLAEPSRPGRTLPKNTAFEHTANATPHLGEGCTSNVAERGDAPGTWLVASTFPKKRIRPSAFYGSTPAIRGRMRLPAIFDTPRQTPPCWVRSAGLASPIPRART